MDSNTIFLLLAAILLAIVIIIVGTYGITEYFAYKTQKAKYEYARRKEQRQKEIKPMWTYKEYTHVPQLQKESNMEDGRDWKAAQD